MRIEGGIELQKIPQGSFELACARVPPKGTVVVPIGMDTKDEVNQNLAHAYERNGKKSLTMVVATHSDANMNDPLAAAKWLVEETKYLDRKGTLALQGGRYDAKQLQAIADRYPGMTVAYQPDPLEPGVTLFRAGREPTVDEGGTISDGGYGKRGCGTPPGYVPGTEKRQPRLT